MYHNSFPTTPNSASAQLDEGAALGILQHLDTQELQKLLDDDSKLNDLITDLQQLRALEVDKETLLASNKSLADYNLQKEPGLRQGKQQLATVYEQAVEIQKSFEENKQKLDYHAAQQSLDTTLALLQTEAAKADEESEALSETFLEGNIELEDFIEKFVSQRTTAHLHRVKAEKMSEILRNQGQSSRQTQPSYGVSVPPPVNHAPAPASNHFSGYPGYPSGQYGMPDPLAYLPR